MLIQRSHKIQLLPNNKQKAKFVSWCDVACWAYNFGLEKKIKLYKTAKKPIGAYALSKEVTVMKHSTHHWLCNAPRSIPRMALQQLDAAYGNFFRRIKNGDKKVGFPRFKSKKCSKEVFHLEPDRIHTGGKRIRLSKMGWVHMTKPLRLNGKLVGTVAISRRASRWYASLCVEVEIPDPIENQDKVGIDLGVKTMAVLSDGKRFENPKAIKHCEQLLARAQRQFTRKQKGSNRKKKAKLRVQRIQKRIADIRANATHKATYYIANNYGFVAIEDLNVSGMVKNHYLSKTILDVNFSEFKRQTNYKVKWVGGTVVTIDRWFPSSQLCSICGCINSGLRLSDRTWACNCGTIHNRDLNAAKNILAKALQDYRGFPVTARGGLEAASSPMKREQSIDNKTLMGSVSPP